MDPYIGEIRMFGGNYNPVYWMLCAGQILSTSEYSALYALIGNTYGGSYPNTFALPDLRGRVPMGWGTGIGLSPNYMGQIGGLESVTLVQPTMPPHDHLVMCNSTDADSWDPVENVAAYDMSKTSYSTDTTSANLQPMDSGAIDSAGSGQAHNNMQPFQAINYIICYQGLFPPRS